jgi:pilus assembly protein CpaC
MKKAELVVKAMGSSVENLITVGIKRMVLVEVQIVEIRRADDMGIGITYPTNLAGNAATASITYTKFDPPNQGQLPEQKVITANGGVSSDFGFRLRFDTGYGRLLSQPKLVCASGAEAHFLVGGEVPIPLITNNTASVEYKEFGVILDLKPNADRQGNISTGITATVSEVDVSLTVRVGAIEVPGFRKRTVKTDVTVKHGETIVLSGLFNYDQQKNVSKVPLLGHIPILGEVFKSRQFLERKNEIAIFVTPKVVNPDSDRVRETIDKIKERYKDAADAVGYNIWD